MQNDLMPALRALGGCAAVDEVTVRWPDQAGTTQTFYRLAGNARWRIKMGDAQAVRLGP